MGAFTLETFPVILRSWKVNIYRSFDPIDSFGESSRVFINKNQTVKIEPPFSDKITQPWLIYKGRLFFDCFFWQHI